MKNLFAFILIFSFITSDCQVVINEISTAQDMGYADEDGSYPDWT